MLHGAYLFAIRLNGWNMRVHSLLPEQVSIPAWSTPIDRFPALRGASGQPLEEILRSSRKEPTQVLKNAIDWLGKREGSKIEKKLLYVIREVFEKSSGHSPGFENQDHRRSGCGSSLIALSTKYCFARLGLSDSIKSINFQAHKSGTAKRIASVRRSSN